MGISTVQSYHGAQVFEAIGLNRDFVDEYFTWTPTRIGGIGIEVVSREVKLRQDRAYPPGRPVVPPAARHRRPVPVPRRRRDAPVQPAHDPHPPARGPDRRLRDVQGLHEPRRRPVAAASRRCAGSWSCGPPSGPCPLDEVEPVESIVRRFKTGAMSYGSISAEAHEALAIAMNRLGGKSNTGEGGEDPARYVPLTRTATRATARSSRSPAAASASPASTSSTPASSRSRWPRAPSPARAASCPAPRSTRGSRKSRHSTPGRRPHQPAAAPRHLLDRGPRRAHPRPQERQPPRPDQREARRRGGRRDDRGRASPRPTPTSS